MKDCDGNILKEGDRVAVQAAHYKTLKVGTVMSFSPKMVRVKVPYAGKFEMRVLAAERLAKVFKQETI